MRASIVSVFGYVLLTASSAWAFAGNAWNLTAPALHQTDSGSRSVAVRKSDGTIWVKKIEPSVSAMWEPFGSPPSGSSSGPQLVDHKDSIGRVTTWLMVRGPFPSDDGNIWAKSRPPSGVWSGWSNVFGKPDSGTTSSPAVARDSQMGMIIAVRDNNGMPWIRRIPAGGAFQPWEQVGTQSIDSAVGIAIDPIQDINVFAAFAPAEDIRVTVCGFPNCFLSWNSLGGFAASGLTATSYTDGASNKTVVAAVVSGDGFVWTTKQENLGGWQAWHKELAIGVTDAEPAIVRSAFSSNNLIVTHRSTGDYFFNGGINLGHP
jgi:hypothetical protein